MKKLTRLALVVALLSALSSRAQQVNEPKEFNAQWSQPYPPFRIVGNLYYVGTYDLACYLIVTPEGHILINTGLAASASLIKENIEALGFRFGDTKILLTTQAHFDHVGAMAAIKEQTGARLLMNSRDATALGDGGVSDYELGQYGVTFKPVQADGKLQDKDTIKLGGTALVMLHHPGHTRGSSSYILDVTDEQTVYRVLIVNMPSIISERKFTEIPVYPEISEDYAYTLKALPELEFDIWLSSHASQFGLHDKHKPGDAYSPEAFVDQAGYDKAVTDLKAQYLKKVEAR